MAGREENIPYSIESPPDWLKNLPQGAIRIGVETFNAVFEESENEEQARMAAWARIKGSYRNVSEGKWVHKSRTADGVALSLGELKPVTLVSDFVSLAGSLARVGKGTDVDAVVKAQVPDPWVERVLSEELTGDEGGVHVHFLERGASGPHVPLYDLALIPKRTIRRQQSDGHTFHFEPGDGKGEAVGYFLQSLKASNELQTVWGIVMVPHVVEKSAGVYEVLDPDNPTDTQGESFTEDGIQRAMHEFNIEWLGKPRVVRLQHGGTTRADIVESFQAPMDMDYGDGKVARKGSWVAAVKIHDPAVWRRVKAGELTGLSPKIMKRPEDVVKVVRA